MSSTSREIHHIILKLALVSHVNAAQPGRTSKSTDDDIGGRRPAGDIDRRADREDGYRQKSAVYFAKKLARTHTQHGLEELLKEAERALYDWQHTPQVAGVEVEYRSFEWRCQIADDDRPVEVVARFYGLKRSQVKRFRAKYRGVRKLVRREAA